MKRIPRIALPIIALLTLLTAAACVKQKTILRIATVGPMSGPSAKMGEDISRGVILAIDEWNSKGGVLGRTIELIIEDDRADPKDAVSVANKIAALGAVGVIGHYNSSCTIPASNIYHENGIIMITPASTNPMVTDRGYPEVFRTCGRDDQQGAVEAKFASEVLGAQKIAILHDKTTYGQGLADEFRKNLSAASEVIFYDGIAVGDKDFTSVLTRIKSLAPDLLMFGGLYAEGGLIVKQMRNLGLSCPFLSGDGVYDPEFIHIAGEAADGAYLSYARSPEQLPSAQKFFADFHARWPEVGPYSLYAYDAANILITAIQATGSTDGKVIADYIHSNKFNGGVGVYQFDAKGDPVYSPYVIWQVRDGQMIMLDTAQSTFDAKPDNRFAEFNPIIQPKAAQQPTHVETH